jgi:hypothetical protein
MMFGNRGGQFKIWIEHKLQSAVVKVYIRPSAYHAFFFLSLSIGANV